MNKPSIYSLGLIMIFSFVNVSVANSDDNIDYNGDYNIYDNSNDKNYIGLDFGRSKGSKFKQSKGIYMSDAQAHSWQLGGNVGRYITNNLRMDISVTKILNLGYRQTINDNIFNGAYDVYDTKIKIDNAMLSAYYDFDIGSDRIRPFFGIGVGYSKIKTRYNMSTGIGKGSLINVPLSKSFSKSNFACKATLGLTLTLSDSARVDISYNYINYGKINFTNIKNIAPSALPIGNLKVHSILFGPKISF